MQEVLDQKLSFGTDSADSFTRLGGRQLFHAQNKQLQPVQRVLGVLDGFDREIQLGAMRDRQQRVADLQRLESLAHQVAECKEVPDRLGHLPVLDDEVL